MTIAKFNTGLSLVQTSFGVYQVDKNLQAGLFKQFDIAYATCGAIGTTQNFVFSGCTPTLPSTGGVIVANYIGLGTPVTSYIKISSFSNPTWLQAVGDTIFVLAVNTAVSTDPTIQVFTYTGTTSVLINAATIPYYGCSNPADNGVNDFEIEKLKSFSEGNIQYSLYTLIYTCKASQESPYFVSILLNEQTQQATLGKAQGLIYLPGSNLTLFADTQCQQVQPLYSDNNGVIVLLLTTNNVMSFVLRMQFDISAVNSTNFSPPSYPKFVKVGTVPPYGNWQSVNALSYQNGYVILPYTSYSSGRSFIALYDFNKIDFTQTYPNPILMAGGYYAPYANELIYSIQKTDSLNDDINVLTVSSSFNYNLSSLIIRPQVTISINVAEKFQEQIIQVTAGNSYDQQNFNMYLSWQEDQNDDTTKSNSGLKWWGILLIILSVIFVIGLGVFGFMKYKESKVSTSSKLLIN